MTLNGRPCSFSEWVALPHSYIHFTFTLTDHLGHKGTFTMCSRCLLPESDPRHRV